MKQKRAKSSRKSGNDRLHIWRGGEFFDPSEPRSVPREIAQRQFLSLASELYCVTADLRDNVFNHFEAVGAPLDKEPLKSALKNWCDRHRLGQLWVLSQVRDTLNIWKLVPQVANLDGPNPLWHPLFDLVMLRPRPATTALFAFNYKSPNFEVTPAGLKEWDEPAGWDLVLERKEEFVGEARKQFEAALRAYCAEQERDAACRGLIRVKRSRASRIPMPTKIKWIVQRYCGRMTFEQIAQGYTDETGQRIDLSTIIKTNNEISQLIELDYFESDS